MLLSLCSATWMWTVCTCYVGSPRCDIPTADHGQRIDGGGTSLTARHTPAQKKKFRKFTQVETPPANFTIRPTLGTNTSSPSTPPNPLAFPTHTYSNGREERGWSQEKGSCRQAGACRVSQEGPAPGRPHGRRQRLGRRERHRHGRLLRRLGRWRRQAYARAEEEEDREGR